VNDYEALELFDFGGILSICFLMLVLSVLSLITEIVYYKHVSCKVIQKQSVSTRLPKICKFSYQSKCSDVTSAMKQLYLLLHSLNEDLDELQIYQSRGRQFSIALEFQINIPDKLDEIVEKFNSFVKYLDSISQR
jgi:hypothetical protein